MANYNGINKGGIYPTRINNKMSESYKVWSNMLRKVYKFPNQTKYSTEKYSVMKEWFEYQTFSKFFYLNWQPGLKMIIKEGEFQYGADTCIFVKIENK